MSQPEPPIYAQAVQATGFNAAHQTAAGSAPEPPQPTNVQPDLDAQIEAMVNARLSQVEAKYEERIAQLQKDLTAAQRPIETNIPEHGGGPGLESAPTWGQWLQEASRAGTLTEEMLAHAGIKV